MRIAHNVNLQPPHAHKHIHVSITNMPTQIPHIHCKKKTKKWMIEIRTKALTLCQYSYCIVYSKKVNEFSQ